MFSQLCKLYSIDKKAVIVCFKALFYHFLGRTEEGHKISVRIANFWIEIRTWDFPDTNQE